MGPITTKENERERRERSKKEFQAKTGREV
jgi:hypothetical protein